MKESNYLRNTIELKAENRIVRRVLTQYACICEWEKGCEIFKELYVLNNGNRIVHRDLESEVDYIYDLVAVNDSTVLNIEAVAFSSDPGTGEWRIRSGQYIDRVKGRIKAMAEKIREGCISEANPEWQFYQV